MKKTFTILHTNDLHSSFIGMGPAADYTPFTLNDAATRGGYARLAGLIAKRKEVRQVDTQLSCGGSCSSLRFVSFHGVASAALPAGGEPESRNMGVCFAPVEERSRRTVSVMGTFYTRRHKSATSLERNAFAFRPAREAAPLRGCCIRTTFCMLSGFRWKNFHLIPALVAGVSGDPVEWRVYRWGARVEQ